jgi:hypothetical protein
MTDKDMTLAQAIKLAKEAEAAEQAAQQAREDAEKQVAKVRSAESKEKIMKALGQVEEYAKSIGEFDDELQKDVKSKVRSIVKAAFGDKWQVNRKKAKPSADKLNFVNDEIVDILKDLKATSIETAVGRKEIEAEQAKIEQAKEGSVFDSNTWSKRDKEKILHTGNNKQMLYYTTD